MGRSRKKSRKGPRGRKLKCPVCGAVIRVLRGFKMALKELKEKGRCAICESGI